MNKNPMKFSSILKGKESIWGTERDSEATSIGARS